MELPIAVMITLFVALAVALLVLQLTNQIIARGSEQLKQFSISKCTENANFFVETTTVTRIEMTKLIKLCYNDSLGTYKENNICYIVHGTLDFTEDDILNDPELDAPTETDPSRKMINPEKVDISEAGKTVYIIFENLTQQVNVLG